MADEVTTTTADDLVLAAGLLEQNIIGALRPNNHGPAATKQRNIASLPTKALDFPKTPLISAAGLTEGTDMANTAFSTTKATITVGETGVMITLTDLLRMSDIVGDEYYAMELAKACLAKLTVDICALSSGFTNSVGPASGSPLLETHWLDAIATLEAANVPNPYVAIIGTTQKKNTIADIGTTITPAASTGATARQELNDLAAIRPDGVLGPLFDFPIYVTTAVPTANAGADVVGMLVSRERAIGLVRKWDVRVGLERDESLRGLEVVVTMAYGVGEIDDTSGVGILSDA